MIIIRMLKAVFLSLATSLFFVDAAPFCIGDCRSDWKRDWQRGQNEAQYQSSESSDLPYIVIVSTFYEVFTTYILHVLGRFLLLGIDHNLGNKMLGHPRPLSITQAMIYNLGYNS